MSAKKPIGLFWLVDLRDRSGGEASAGYDRTPEGEQVAPASDPSSRALVSCVGYTSSSIHISDSATKGSK
ncbi:hypothetical protein AVDCRST_MAG82-194 [uncultured Rubrobacteraceae bacterium]|uniref:Uncharacterized protein n=1 Tax=uncultured Rubrobacteraceae bacterium TaxID=349277 RepID=A0A6J4NZ69_9ACTN|nr:hypothetical protein AVDCRST_MAG82-194 [uncultured Rubrobacteraceae bacterium]